MTDHINDGGPAYPSVLFTHEKGPNDHDEGMTKREVAAIAAMQAILTARHHLSFMKADKLAREAVVYADALIAELGEGQ